MISTVEWGLKESKPHRKLKSREEFFGGKSGMSANYNY